MRWAREQKFKIVGHHIWDTTRCDPTALRSQVRTAAAAFIRNDAAPVRATPFGDIIAECTSGRDWPGWICLAFRDEDTVR